jgi:acyl carrier protein
MNTKEVKDILAKIFHEVAPEIEFATIDTSRPLRDQVEIDSFDFYRIIVQIDKRLGVNIPDSKIAEFNSLDDLIQYVVFKSGPSPALYSQNIT